MEPYRGRQVRANLLAGILIALLGGLAFRCWRIQHQRHAEYLEIQRRQALTTVSVAPQRGTIRDAHGKTLAISIPVESVWIDPRQLSDPRDAAQRLAEAVGEDPEVLGQRLESDRREVPVKRKVTPEQAAAVRALRIPGVSFRREFRRAYPEGILACHLLGFADLEETGREGLEFALEAQLAGMPGRHVVSRDALQNRIDLCEEEGTPPIPGLDVVLTLDSTVQYHVERALDQAMRDWHAASACAVLLDVRTGDILALAARPCFDPNRYGQSSAEDRKNRAVTDPLEPGSTMKPFIVAAVLQYRLHSPTDGVDCENGVWTEGRRTIRDHHGYSVLSVRDVIAKSSNIGIGKLGLELGRERLHDWLEQLGFGRASGCRLPKESSGLVHPLARWGRDSVKSVSMGYEILATPLQMAAAYATLANRGIPVRPRIVRRIEDPETGRPEREVADPAPAAPLLSEAAWRDWMEILGEVVASGTGVKAKVSGYRVGGKTGTARKTVRGVYSSSKVATLFAAIAPVSDPRVALVVVLDEPRGAPFAGTAVGPVAGAILKEVLRHLQIPPDAPEVAQQPGAGS